MSEKWKEVTGAALQGKLLLRLKADKYLPQIIFFFIMSTAFIWINLNMESTIHRKEENKQVLENLKSVHTELTCQLTGLDSICKVEDMLQEKGSRVKIPVQQAKWIRTEENGR